MSPSGKKAAGSGDEGVVRPFRGLPAADALGHRGFSRKPAFSTLAGSLAQATGSAGGHDSRCSLLLATLRTWRFALPALFAMSLDL